MPHQNRSKRYFSYKNIPDIVESHHVSQQNLALASQERISIQNYDWQKLNKKLTKQIKRNQRLAQKKMKGKFDDEFKLLASGNCDNMSSESEKDYRTSPLSQIRKLPMMSNARLQLNNEKEMARGDPRIKRNNKNTYSKWLDNLRIPAKEIQ
jgi:hypothetical protein